MDAGENEHMIIKKIPDFFRNPGFCRYNVNLALGELGSAACGLQRSAVLSVQTQQSAGDAVTDSAGLAGNAAASDGDNDVNLAQQIGGVQGLTDDQLQSLQTEVIVDVAAVDDDGTGAVLVDANAGHRGLTTAGAVKILLLALVHSSLPPNQSRVQASGFWAT